MRILFFCAVFLINTIGYCSDLEIVNCNVFLTKTEEREISVKKEKEWKKEKSKLYTYRVTIVLKNTSDEELSVVTRGLDILHFKEHSEIQLGLGHSILHFKEHSEIQLGLGHSTVKGVAIVPSVVDFAIVNLKPGEGASVRFRDTS